MNEQQQDLKFLDNLVELLLESNLDNSQTNNLEINQQNPPQNELPSLIIESESHNELPSLIIESESHNELPSLIIESESQNQQNVSQLITNLESKITQLEQKLYEPTDIINPVIPLIKELLSIKINESREVIVNALLPILDDVIKQKSYQDPDKMGEAISAILPTAITKKITEDPHQIAEAIAPEIASAIAKQIELKKGAIAETLGPEMGKAIKKQIEHERDAMIDALYPVIGSTISKYMGEVIDKINQKVENNLSFEGIKRKINAKIQGVSEAELIFQESINFEVEAVFLIHKSSGLIIKEFQTERAQQIEAEMLAGMLTAIRSFANDCIISENNNSELNQIDYSDFKIIMEVAGYCYLAIIAKGDAEAKFLENIRQNLGIIILKYGEQIKEFDGDSSTISDSINPLLESLITTESKPKLAKNPTSLIILVSLIFLMIIIPWGMIQYRSWIAHKIETKTTLALEEIPELSVYKITAKVRQRKLILTGKLPNQYLREKAFQVAKKINPNIPLDNQIIAVKLPPDPLITAQEIKRMTELLNQQKDVNIISNYENYTVKLKGITTQDTDITTIINIFKKIPGVDSVLSEIQYNLPVIETRIYFAFNSSDLHSLKPIKTIKEFLDENPLLHVKIIGHTDYLGQEENNEKLAKKRAKVVQDALISQGVNPARLHISGSPKPPSDVDSTSPLWLSRCVIFKTFIPKSE